MHDPLGNKLHKKGIDRSPVIANQHPTNFIFLWKLADNLHPPQNPRQAQIDPRDHRLGNIIGTAQEIHRQKYDKAHAKKN